MQARATWATPANWLFCITVDTPVFGRSRDALAAELDSQGIETRPFFHPLHALPPYAGGRMPPGGLPETLRVAGAGLNLPTSTTLTNSQIDRIVGAIDGARR